jgi:OOP family OmpA-OmpF porin
MDALARLTPCGSSRQLDELGDRDALFAFQQIVFNGPAPPPEPARARTLVDLDRDGVDDRRDRCARTPLGAEVDERGCWVIDDYVFESGSARLRKDQLAGLDRVLAVLAANPGLRVRLDGHTDNTGTAEFNFGLARRRAEAIRLFLSDAGIDPDRLQIRSFGPTRPIASHDTAAGRQKNRRVELSVLDRAPAGAGPGLVSGP